MAMDQKQSAYDDWQSALLNASHNYARTLKELHDTNPWPENPVLASALNTLGTELWDRRFSVPEIAAAFNEAAADLARYAAGEEVRP